MGGVDLSGTIGAVFSIDPPDGTSGSAFYGTEDAFSVTQIALAAAKEIPITEQFALPIFVQYILNPSAERTFLVFGVSL